MSLLEGGHIEEGKQLNPPLKEVWQHYVIYENWEGATIRISWGEGSNV